MKALKKEGFSYQDVISFGNMFLLGNGRYGYRGTLEEFRAKEMVGLNVLGFYDRFGDKWREPINLPNPFYVLVSTENGERSLLKKEALHHEIILDLENALFQRKSEFEDIDITSKRFLSQSDKDDLFCSYSIKAKQDTTIEVHLGLDLDIYEINGPHFLKKEVKKKGGVVSFFGKTNEGKTIETHTHYSCDKGEFLEWEENGIAGYRLSLSMKAGEEATLKIVSHIGSIEKEGLKAKRFEEAYSSHQEIFHNLWKDAYVEIEGDEEAQFELLYSIYHLLILEDKDSLRSIPARGVSGQTYKGAIFWDTEVFMLPFYTLTNPSFAKNTLLYRIKTLEGAKKKAKKYGFEGAFYAWESQEDGIEQCTDYNVTDPITNQPIRTYFADKQIHISGDIALAFDRYIKATGDTSILKEGGYDVIYECMKFYRSYLSKGEQYHLNDVMGPDEYHERVNDNAYTNMLVKNVFGIGIRYFDSYYPFVKEKSFGKEEMVDIFQNLYIPEPNENGIIEQFDGYFGLEDVDPKQVKARVRSEKEYLGGLASKTRVIKQADVLSELILLDTPYDLNVLKKNYDFYAPYTEHGSSLSASIYSLAASKLGMKEDAYHLFRKSSGIDLGLKQKLYAGGIYIGGTHPASNAGAYLSLVLGFAGLSFDEDGFHFSPNLPESISKVSFKFHYRKKQYQATIAKGQAPLVQEVNHHD